MLKKQIFTGLIILISSFGAVAQQGFTVNIRLYNVPMRCKLQLTYDNGQRSVLDTVSLNTDGFAVFKGIVAEPTQGIVTIKGDTSLGLKLPKGTYPSPVLSFFLSNDTIDITGDEQHIYKANIKGGKENEEFKKLRDALVAIEDSNWVCIKSALLNYVITRDKKVLNDADKKKALNDARYRSISENYIHTNPDTWLSMYLLDRNASGYNHTELEKNFDRMGSTYKNTVYGLHIAEKIKVSQATALGQPAIPLRKKDMYGRMVDLASLQGKYVLLDFWGSWCHPCRMSHPHLKEIYTKYHDKGLEIVGIAEENSRDLQTALDNWKGAVKADELTWTQILNQEDIQSFDAVKAYGITAFPTKILLDKDGRIIDTFIGSETQKLDAKLKQLFGE